MPSPVTPILDNFNRANEGPPPSSSWITSGSPGHKVISNQCGNDVAGGGASTWNTQFAANQEAYVTIATKPPDASGSHLLARMTGSGNNWNTDSYYFASWEAIAGTDALKLFYFNGSTSTQIGSTVNLELTNGDQLLLNVVGSALTVSVNGTSQITGTDSNITGAGYIAIADGDTGNTIRFEDFGGGPIQFRQRSASVFQAVNRSDHF